MLDIVGYEYYYEVAVKGKKYLYGMFAYKLANIPHD